MLSYEGIASHCWQRGSRAHRGILSRREGFVVGVTAGGTALGGRQIEGGWHAEWGVACEMGGSTEVQLVGDSRSAEGRERQQWR
jgi:hypothetical protein